MRTKVRVRTKIRVRTKVRVGENESQGKERGEDDGKYKTRVWGDGEPGRNSLLSVKFINLNVCYQNVCLCM